MIDPRSGAPRRQLRAALSVSAVLCGMLLTGCGQLPSSASTAGLPATGIALASVVAPAAPTPSSVGAPTLLPTGPRPPGTPVGSTESASPSPSAMPAACTDRASYVSDVTVRDDSEVTVGTAFVKIWRLQNAGTCTWTPDYGLVFFGGERMSAAAVIPLSATVGPSMQADLPVDMVAPGTPGTYQGFWRLRSSSGSLFGIGPGGDESFWVRIVVVPQLTPSPSLSPSPTVTPTPAVIVTGTVELQAGSSLDLDSGNSNPVAGADLLFNGADIASGSLNPAPSARLAHYSPPPPTPGPVDCLSAPLSLDALPTSGLAPGSLVCYLTDLGRPGYFEVMDDGAVLRLRFTTWNP